MLRLLPEADVTRLNGLFDELSVLIGQLDGCSGFVAGSNRDFEGKSVGYTYGFTLDARDKAALARYAENPLHRAIGTQLVALCDGGAEGIRAYDLEMTG